MKKFLFIFLFIIILVGVGFFMYNSSKHQDITHSSNYTAERTSTTQENLNVNSLNNNTISGNTLQTENKNQKSSSKKNTISKFSTKLPKDTKARYSNINLACNSLDGTIVKANETFSLWNTLGCPTKQKGYRKAKAFTNTGKIRYSYGGGICQVSTTIYNALLKVDGIKILERHEHSRDVVYIKDGKDAAVSYKSADLRFKNNLNYDIKLRASVKNNNIVIKLEKV